MRGVEDAIEIRVPPVVDPESATRFARDFDNAAQSDSSRVVVLVGEEQVFCRGLQPLSMDSLELREHLQSFADCLLRMRFARKPIIAVVDGSALGGGLGLAASADMVIASDRSTFGLPEALFGLVPAIILPLLLERMRPQDCRLWMLSGNSRSASEALSAGVADVTCPVEELKRRTTRAVRSLSRTDGDVVQRVKSMTARPDLERAVKEGVQTAFELLTQPRVRARFQRFLEDGTLPWGNS